jgi:hypothetical protein
MDGLPFGTSRLRPPKGFLEIQFRYWCPGKVDELMRAATVQQKAMRQDLVLVPRHEQAKAEYECLFGKLGSGGYGYGGAGNADGFEAGKNVSLSKGIKSDGPIRQIAKSG